MMSAEEIVEVLRKHRDEIKRFGVKELWLFGSYVRGEAGKGSDVDILVEFEPGKKTFDNYMGLKLYLEELLGVEVDPITVEALKPGLVHYLAQSSLTPRYGLHYGEVVPRLIKLLTKPSIKYFGRNSCALKKPRGLSLS